VITAIERLDADQVRLQIVGTNASSYAVQASGSLSNWLTVATLAGSNAPIRFIDTRATNATSRFYRVLGGP
jgi:hypothetical protein